MALETYRRKRDFRTTTEPSGEGAPAGAAKGGTLAFVVQKHAARHLHYDFRLELDGVLKSWAVPKGPSPIVGEKRLAVQVEDHPLDYGTFEGTIPQGQYGAGTVEIWDHGTWTPLHDAHEGLAKGHLDFELHGEKLHGHWNLVRMKGKPDDRHDNWLLIKADDTAAHRASSKAGGKAGGKTRGKAEEKTEKKADTPDSPTPAGRRARTPPDPASDPAPSADPAAPPLAPATAQATGQGAAPDALPAFVPPALATLVAHPPVGKGWEHEIKFDGYRLQARIENGSLTLLTRNGLDWTAKFGPALHDALAGLAVKNALIDGELVVEPHEGISSFSALQADLSEGRTDRFVFYAFDLLFVNGQYLRNAPLKARRQALRAILPQASAILRLSESFEDDGALVLRHACDLGLEGVVSKQVQAPYQSGRGRSWLKSKCSARQEFVIGGYVPSTTGRKSVGALVLGVYDKSGGLRYVGRVGTGFTMAVASTLFTMLDAIRIDKSPFATRLSTQEARNVRYTRPQCVAEVEFRAWTADGRLRHASYRGLRDDKPAAEIIRETPQPAMVENAVKTVQETQADPTPKNRRGPAPPDIAFTHPDRVYWPDAGITKKDLAAYYMAAWSRMGPFIVDRPLAILRCPDGLSGPRFFQKNTWKGMNAHILSIQDPMEKEDKKLIGVHDLDGLLGLVQSAALEIHPWEAPCADLEKPDELVMDLDPGEGVAWAQVLAAAQEVRERLEAAGLHAFVKTSGGKGLHVVAPLKPHAGWDATKAFCKTLAQGMAADTPALYVATISKAKRQGRILLDYLRNQRGATSVAPYSTRARPGAPVSMPLDWDELKTLTGPAEFTLRNAPARMTSAADPWADFNTARRVLAAPAAADDS
ncbi:DNA ligase D [Acetobacter sp. TBRC 12305]|uniref:DNA ligase (ATP) n=1 Tax=Acetobacter garciniae TaxID=2817435 RepID=A0A939HMY4_9PROT|nr:DNA ligase D [Acetobacter garciniae]MBO1325146.1 DNA ligase D [Acetobacter garciniae]MBX0344883.1 DNA ligase D [Acetobacter garciniae]